MYYSINRDVAEKCPYAESLTQKYLDRLPTSIEIKTKKIKTTYTSGDISEADLKEMSIN